MNENKSILSIKKGINLDKIILLDGKPIGRAWKILTNNQYGVKINGVYWQSEEPSNAGGFSATSVKRLKDVIPLAQSLLNAGFISEGLK